MARERATARRGRLRRSLVLGPLHGPGRPDRPGRRGLDDPRDGGRARRRASRSGRSSLNVMNRHPAVLARMASTLQIASGGRLILGMGIGGAPKEHAAYGIDVPRGAGAGRPARGGDRGDPRPVDRRSRHAAVAVLPARRRLRVPGPDPAAADRHRRRDAGRGAARRPDRRRLDRVRRQLRARTCRSTSRRSRRRAGGATTSGCSSGSRATGSGDADIAESRWVREPRATWERWREAGADGAIVLARTTADVDALVEAAERW